MTVIHMIQCPDVWCVILLTLAALLAVRVLCTLRRLHLSIRLRGSLEGTCGVLLFAGKPCTVRVSQRSSSGIDMQIRLIARVSRPLRSLMYFDFHCT